MFITPLSESEIQAYNAKGGSNAKNTDPQAMQERFMKMLVAQINNQDPLNPMDNAQMTSQMAQINTVSGIQQLNTTVEALAGKLVAMQGMQGTSLVGREVVAEGNRLSFADGVGQGSLSLAGAADSVKVEILGAGEQILDTVTLGALPAGMHNFGWNDTAGQSALVKGFRVVASSAGKAVETTTLARQRVESVGMVDGVMRLRTDAGTTLSYDQILAFM